MSEKNDAIAARQQLYSIQHNDKGLCIEYVRARMWKGRGCQRISVRFMFKYGQLCVQWERTVHNLEIVRMYSIDMPYRARKHMCLDWMNFECIKPKDSTTNYL